MAQQAQFSFSAPGCSPIRFSSGPSTLVRHFPAHLQSQLPVRSSDFMTPRSKETNVLTPAPPTQDGFSLISNEKLLHLYSAMLKCRILAERSDIIKLASNDSAVGSVSLGQEAGAVGITIDLLPGDTVAPPLGDIIPFFINNLPLGTMLNGLFNPIAPAPKTNAQFKIATDDAMLNKLTGNGKIAVAFSSHEPASPGPWHESLSFAGLHDLPMIFILMTASGSHLSSRTKALHFPVITVDGNDVVAVYRVASEAIAHARRGNGPTLIECRTYPSNPGDPVMNMEKYLASKGLFSEKFKREETAGFKKELEIAMESAGNRTRVAPFSIPIE
jgi:TPP-dependent pyruvate/acetoin dehydrogenase alpha subunit